MSVKRIFRTTDMKEFDLQSDAQDHQDEIEATAVRTALAQATTEYEVLAILAEPLNKPALLRWARDLIDDLKA